MDSTLEWLQEIEALLQDAVIELRQIYKNAGSAHSAGKYLAYSKAQERLSGIQGTIIELLQGRVTLTPPDLATIAKAKSLSTELQQEIQHSKQADAILKLSSDLSALVHLSLA